MPWENVKLSEIAPEDKEFSAIPGGVYTMSLRPGATYRESRQIPGTNELNVGVAITEGDFQGRVLFMTYPDPDSTTASGKSNKWSAQALKKLEISLGLDSTAGEDPAEFLNRAASNGHSTFKASVKTREANGKTYNDVQLFSVAPAV